jgi:hypothetical protein
MTLLRHLLLGAFCFLHAETSFDPAGFINATSKQIGFHWNGWCSEQKLLHFVDLVLKTEPEVCVEIGVYKGASMVPVALALKALGKGVVFGIDPWDTDECLKHFDPKTEAVDYANWEQIDMRMSFRFFHDVIQTYKLESYCIPLIGTSEQCAPWLPPIDILYIDGAHDEATSAKDV